MNLTNLKTAVANEAGLDLTDSSTDLTAWINSAYRYISGSYNWPWLLKSAAIATATDITTGTVSINSGSTSLTFSSAPSVSVAGNYMIKFTSVSDDWYYISSHTASSTSATLASSFLGASNISGAAYICRKVFYSLPTDCDRIVDIRQAITKVRLIPVNTKTFDHYLPDPSATADPVYYAPMGLDSSKNWQITVYPVPSRAENLQLRYMQKITELSSGSDEPLIPAKFHDAIVFAALYLYAHPFIDDSRFAAAKTRFDELIETMKREYNPVPDQMTVLQPWDQRPTYPSWRLRFPSNFGWPWGGY